MELAEITKLAGRSRKRRRIGRGPGSGHGKTSGRGHKGGGSRSGWRLRGMAEGGQMPLFRRVPKRGFNNAKFATRFNIVNLYDLETCFDSGANVTPAALFEAGLIRRRRLAVKVLGAGSLSKVLTVEAAGFSRQAKEKIEAAGGTVKQVAARV